jgi:HD superfamily phosphohydrolase
VRFTSSVRDAVYGMIPLTGIEQEVMKLPMMGRLKSIKQLGLAYLAFPGANHSRFEHSAGAMHISYLMGQSLDLEDSDLQAVRLAALLHDVGHPPFSHTVEFAFELAGFKSVPSHAVISGEKIKNDIGLKKILESHSPLLHQDDLAAIATGKFTNKALSRIIDGPLDADKIDYILRDNYHCGFPVALDVNTITEIFEVKEGREIILREPGLSFAEQLFVGRYHLITQIHHNKTNRLGNYLLALALGESLGKMKPDSQKETIRKMFNEWTDSDLLSFLQNQSKTYYALLRQHMLGEEPLQEIGAFAYEDLTPFGRYNAWLLAENLSSLQSVSKKLQGEVRGKRIFVDAYHARPPETGLSVDVQPPIQLIDSPLTRGAVDASLEKVYISVYALEELKPDDLNFDRIVRNYKRDLDSSFDKSKAESLMKDWAKSEPERMKFLLRHLVEILTNKEAINVRRARVISSDVLLLFLIAMHSAFMKAFKRKVFIDSIRQLVEIYLDMQSKGVLISGGKPISPYKISRSKTGFDFPRNLTIDIERLERLGLVHRFSRVIKVGERFRLKNQLRITGWGRGYYQRNLSRVEQLRTLEGKFGDYFEVRIRVDKQKYNAYFGFLDQAEAEAIKARADILKDKADDVKKTLPIKVSY